MENTGKSQSVFHMTNEAGIRGIVNSGSIRPSLGNYGKAVYAILDMEFTRGFGDYVVEALADLSNVPVFSIRFQALRKPLFGSPYSFEMIQKLWPNKFDKETINDFISGYREPKWLDFLQKNSPGFIFDGKGMSTWIVAYNPSILSLQQIGKIDQTNEVQWAPANQQGIQQLGLV